MDISRHVETICRAMGNIGAPLTQDQRAILTAHLSYTIDLACAPIKAERDAAIKRYDYVRRLNVHQFATLFKRNLAGENFDDIVDVACGNRSSMQDRWPVNCS